METGRRSRKPLIKLAKDPMVKSLPEDFTFVIPRIGLDWLAGVNISPELARLYNIGYSASWDRVIVPSYLDGVLLGWQGRLLGEVPGESSRPKYLQAEGQKPLLFLSHSARTNPSFVVLVEDAASAIVLGEHLPTVAILGTSFDREGKQLALLASITKSFVLWLDGDQAGQAAARILEKRLDNIGLVLETVTTAEDPKHANHLEQLSQTQHLRRLYADI